MLDDETKAYIAERVALMGVEIREEYARFIWQLQQDITSAAEGLDWKASCKYLVSDKDDIPSSAEPGDRILLALKGQPEDNGIYVVPDVLKAEDWNRAKDAEGPDLSNGAVTYIEKGEHAGEQWVLVDAANGRWSQYASTGQAPCRCECCSHD